MKYSGDLIRSDLQRDDESRALATMRESRESPRYQLPFDLDPEVDDEQGRSLPDYWAMVRDRLWLILALTFVVTVSALIYTGRQRDVYEAEARIQVDTENNPALG